ncbi:MAG: helix-turn-helix domain-containing protein [Haloglomus sp.]
MTQQDKEIDLSARDITILKARIKYPTASLRELQETLEEEYDISLSHNRINDILREMKSDGLFRILAAPNLELFEHHLFRISFHYPNFSDRWEECYRDLMRDPHVVMFFTADDYHQWQFITQFRTGNDSEEWKIDFFMKHGDIIAQFDKTALPNIHQFEYDARVFDDILAQHDDGDQYIDGGI